MKNNEILCKIQMEEESHKYGSYGKQDERTIGTTSSWVIHVTGTMDRSIARRKGHCGLGTVALYGHASLINKLAKSWRPKN